MAKNKMGLSMKGMDELIGRLEGMHGNVKAAVEECLIQSQQIVADNLEVAMNKHQRTGDTKESIVKDGQVEWQGTKARIEVGFKFPEGLPSVFLMYGTPRTQKDSKVYSAVYGAKTRKMIKEKQEEILKAELRRAGGG